MYGKLMILLVALFSFSTKPEAKWLISQSSSLRVNGSTNVNKFSCDIASCDQADTLTVWKCENSINLTGSINPAVLSFDCHKAMMTHDLRKTLKAKQYPKLHIRFLSLSELPNLSIRPARITGQVEIEIAGVKKLYAVNYQISDTAKTVHLIGSQAVNFSDFNLIPPHKLGGMIKTKDQLTVSFHLKMKNIL